MLHEKEENEKGDTWCTILVGNIKTKVKVRHIGKGKFKVINDEQNGNLIGNLLDASDIFHCS
jgi:hypothetical protein